MKGFHGEDTGFSLVELLISSIIILLAAAGSLLAISYSGFFSKNAKDRSAVDALIENDVAKLNLTAYRYTFCSGTYKWDGSACVVGANSYLPGSQNYYFPFANNTTNANAVTFGNNCNSGSMINSLIGAINGGDSTLALSSAAAGLGIQRADATADDASAHRIRISYSYKGNSTYRVVIIVPMAAGWCP